MGIRVNRLLTELNIGLATLEDVLKALGYQETPLTTNTKLEVSIRDLELTKQKPNESCVDFLTRFMNKAGLMKNKLAEKDQVRMIVHNVSPNLVKRL